MPIYKQTTEITNIDDLLSSVERDIEEVYFGDKNVFTMWGEYDGTLPAQYSANGSALADYRIYGASGGVGDDSGTAYGYVVDMSVQSANLAWTGWAQDAVNRIAYSGHAKIETINGRDCLWFSAAAGYNSYDTKYIFKTDFKENTQYVFAYEAHRPSEQTASPNVQIIYTDGSEQTIASKPSDNFEKYEVVSQVGKTIKYLTASYYSGEIYIDLATFMVAEGSTPLPYQPYNKTVTPIYIGSSPLNAYEYIDYASGRIYRWSSNQLSVPEVREKVNEEVTCTVSNDGVYTLTVSDTVQSDRILSFSYNPVETPDGKTWVVAAFAENILDDNGMITLGDAIHPVASAYIRNNGYNVNRASSPSATTYILDRMAITVRAGTPAGTFTLRPMLMYIEPTDPPVPLPALPTVDGTTITDYAGQSAAVPSRFTAKYRKEGF